MEVIWDAMGALWGLTRKHRNSGSQEVLSSHMCEVLKLLIKLTPANFAQQ